MDTASADVAADVLAADAALAAQLEQLDNAVQAWMTHHASVARDARARMTDAAAIAAGRMLRSPNSSDQAELLVDRSTHLPEFIAAYQQFLRQQQDRNGGDEEAAAVLQQLAVATPAAATPDVDAVPWLENPRLVFLRW